MKRTFVALFFIVLSVFFTSISFAQKLSVSPQTINLGDSVDVTINNIPTNDTVYNLQLKLASVQNANFMSRVLIAVQSGKCTIEQKDNFWTSASCSGDGPFTFIGKLTTTQINPPDPTITASYSLLLSWAVGSQAQSAEQSFSINPSKQSTASFTIDSITPNPARPGDALFIKISTTKSGTYGYGISGDQLNTADCGTPSCSLSLLVSNVTSSTSANVIVIDPDNKRRSAPFNILQPTPTPSPPPPPCRLTDVNVFICSTALGDITTKPEEFVKFIFGISLSLSGGIALILVIISGYRIMASQGNPEKLQQAREQLTSAIVGLLFIIFSVTILQIVGFDILHIPGFAK